ncbi:mechanosensitive ion channel domain-containing protein [Hydrogenophilus thiooxidans]|uniref:mechanosensitive ion channel domain-containing protein n=1 Tax=Hydrogenophilus thiooxidans TaxID=2820326 RepID=UPI001C2358CF|nr:mechanosensitive ion channel domain-containing protein [Hydrogenophilus thiooxidans]
MKRLITLVWFLVAVTVLAANEQEPPASSGSERNNPLALIDRTLQSEAATGRSKEYLQKLRERTQALQKLEADLQLRLTIAEQSFATSRGLWETVRKATLPDLAREYQQVAQKGTEAVSEWLQRTEEQWLSEKRRWEQEKAALERQTIEAPAELTQPVDPLPPGTPQAVQTIAQLIQLQWEKTQQLWQAVQKREEEARAVRWQIVTKQLQLTEMALQAIEKLRPKGNATPENGQNDPLWRQIAERNHALQELLTATNQKIAALKAIQDVMQKRLETYQQQLQRLEALAKTHGLTPLVGFQFNELRQEMVEWRGALTDAWQAANEALSAWQQIEIELVQAQQRQAAFEQAVEAHLAALPEHEQTSARIAFQRLLDERRTVLARLAALRTAMTQAASDLEATTHSAERFREETLATLQGYLLWAKSALPWWSVAGSEAKAVVTHLVALIEELPKGLATWKNGVPVAAFLSCALWLTWWLARGLLARKFAQTLPHTAARTSAGTLATLTILLIAAIQAAGVALFLFTISFLLRPTGGTALAALGDALEQTALVWWNLHFWRIALTHQGGLLHHRYQIPEATVQRLRPYLTLFVWVSALIATLFAYLGALGAPDESGTPLRSVLLIAALWLLLSGVWFFRSATSGSFMPRVRNKVVRLAALVLALPLLASILLLVIGYRYTAEAVLIAYWRSLWALLGVALLFDLTRAIVDERWRLVVGRKRTELPAFGSESLPTEAAAQELHVTEAEAAIERGSRQLRRIVRWGAWLALATLLLWIWAPLLPALSQLDTWVLWRYQEVSGNETLTVTVTVADLLFTGVALAVLTLLTRNAPTLLELLLAQTKRLDDGAKYAIVTLFRYLLISVGVVWILNRLGMPWSKLQWLVAALSVGLGFGLQEIVANFVSGLIILFERPIRVGDIVTVQGVTGRVKRMTIRATVIETLDKQEVLIPNKAIITGNVSNWTLSDLQSRIVLPVGVAYGSDLEQVRALLLDVAQSHPNVLTDPAPTVAFSQFGGSSVEFELRCYVADIAVRGETKTELALAIANAFRANGVEIPFPQNDLHVRSVAPEVVAALRNAPSASS